MTDTHRRPLELSNEMHALIAEFKSFRELMSERDKRYDERDKRYDGKFAEQDKAVVAALAAQKELTNAAFLSSEKAIVKAEGAQISYNERTNELRGTLDDQARMQLPRAEANARFESFDIQINEIKKQVSALRESQSSDRGKDDAISASKLQGRWIVGLVIATLLSMIGSAITIALFMLKP